MDWWKWFCVSKGWWFNGKKCKVRGVLIRCLGCNKVGCWWSKGERGCLFLESGVG